MQGILFWIIVAYVSGAIPWSFILGVVFSREDIRTIGDGNPGSVNAWKLSGPAVGILSTFLDIGKGFLPAYIFMKYLDQTPTEWTELGLGLVLLAPTIGHAWSPLLRFKGGKALATTWGSWIAVTNGIALPAGCIFLGSIHGIQKNHAITVTICLILFFVVFWPLYVNPYIAIYGLLNLSVVIWKHKTEYSNGFIFRGWVRTMTRTIS